MKREKFLDVSKGFSIWCIVFLHYEEGVFPESFNTFIGSFMVTIFYVCSGWLLSQKKTILPIRSLLEKRWLQLGKPYIYWTVIILCFDLVLYFVGYYDVYFLSREVYKAIILRGIGTLWFLPALFGGEVLFHLFIKRSKIHVLGLIGAFIYLQIYRFIFDGQDDFVWKIINGPFRTVSNIFVAWFGITIGYCYGKIIWPKFIKLKSAVQLFLSILLLLIAYCSVNGILFYHIPVISDMMNLFAPLGILSLCKVLTSWKSFPICDYWGRHSLNLMVTHYSITMVLFSLVIEKIMHWQFFGWISILCFLCSIPIQYFFVKIVDKKYPFLLGK